MSDFWAKDTYYNRCSNWVHVAYCNGSDSGHHSGIPCVYCDETPAKRPWAFPLTPPEGEYPLLPDAPGQFGAERKHDFHTGLDFYCEVAATVQTVERGRVIAIEAFTGPNAESPWWNETWAVLVEGPTGVVVYGEVDPCVKVGDKVEHQGTIGAVIPVLKKFKGRPMVMLHLELMKAGSTETVWWKRGEPRPACLLDPTEMFGSEHWPTFDLSTYDGERYRA